MGAKADAIQYITDTFSKISPNTVSIYTNKFKNMMTSSKEDTKLEKLRILMPDKTDEQLKVLLEVLNR